MCRNTRGGERPHGARHQVGTGETTVRREHAPRMAVEGGAATPSTGHYGSGSPCALTP